MSFRSVLHNSRFAVAAVITCSVLLIVLLLTKEWEQLSAERERIIERAVRRNSNLALTLESYTVRTLQHAEMLIQLLQAELDKKQDFRQLDQKLQQSTADRNLYDALTLIDTTGRVWFSSGGPAGTARSYEEAPFFLHHKNQPGHALHVSTPLTSATTGKTVIMITRRLEQAGGGFRGVVALEILPYTFTAFYEKAVVNPHDIVSLIAPNGITYARLTGTVPSQGENISKSPLFGYLRSQPVGTYFARDAIRGIPTYFSYRAMSQYPIIATVGTSEKDVLEDFHRRKVREVLFTLGICFMIALFAALLCSGILQRRRYFNLLKESEEKYRLMFENSGDAIVLMSETGQLQALNPAAHQLFGLQTGAFPEGGFCTLVHPADQQRCKDPDTGLIRMPALNRELRFTRANGSVFEGEVHASAYASSGEKKVIVAVIRDTTERKRLQEELIREKTQRQQLVTKQVIQAQENERNRLGRELHDNVCQLLTTVKIYISLISRESAKQKEYIAKSQQYLDMSIRDIRDLSHALSTPGLSERTLRESVSNLLHDTFAGTALKVACNIQPEVENAGMEEKLALFRIIQEQIHNIQKHAGASELQLNLTAERSMVVLTIQDNGKGFDPAAQHSGIGLSNMETRVQVFAGQFSVQSAPGQGCSIRVALPMPETVSGRDSVPPAEQP